MFFGTAHPRLDEKNRLILPARYRDGLAGGLVITKGQERCLDVWPTAEWDAYREQLRAASRTSERVRHYTRILYASAHDDTPDKQGRITLPQGLRDYAGITRDCVMTGQDTRAEIWDAQAWETYQAAQDAAFAGFDGDVIPMP